MTNDASTNAPVGEESTDARIPAPSRQVPDGPVGREDVLGELALVAAPDVLAALERNPTLRALTVAREARRRLRVCYFDTEDGLLRQHGLAVGWARFGRVTSQRLEGPRAIIDRILGAARGRGADAGWPSPRSVLSWSASGRLPRLPAVIAAGVAGVIGGPLQPAALRPVLEIALDRRVVALSFMGGDVELVRVEGEAVHEAVTLNVTETVLLARSGRAAWLLELAANLAREHSFSIDWRPSPERYFRAFEPDAALPVRARSPSLNRRHTVGEALDASARSCLAQLLANEPAVRAGDDPEGIHQMRVAVRRLRALLSVYREILDVPMRDQLREQLKWLQSRLGPARDWDVFIHESLEPLHARYPGDVGMDALSQVIASRRRAAYVLASATLDDGRFAEIALRLNLALVSLAGLASGDGGLGPGTPVIQHATRVLRKRARRIVQYGRAHETFDEPAMHELRLHAKKLRYALEFFASLYPKKSVRRYHRSIVALQDTLGTLNDAVVADSLIEELANEVDAPTDSDLPIAHGLGLLRGWQAMKAVTAIERFDGAWRAFCRARPFWER